MRSRVTPKSRPDLFQRAAASVVDAEPELQHAALALAQCAERAGDLLPAQLGRRGLGGRGRVAVLDEVAEVGVLLLADGGFERDGLLRDFQYLADALRRDLHALGDLVRRGFAPVLLYEAAADAHQLVDGLDHVDGDADRARLIGDGAGDGLPYPPGGVGGELVALPVVELLDRADSGRCSPPG